jgi:hypothetical protein
MNELRIGKPVVTGDVTIVPVERFYIRSIPGKMGCWLSGLKMPFAIIFSDATGIRAYDTEAAEISVGSLIQKIPELSKVLVSSKQKK